MKFKIYKEDEEEVTKIRLISSTSNSVYIVAVNDEGKPLDGGYIACITNEGMLALSEDVDSKLGFQVDEGGRIKVLY